MIGIIVSVAITLTVLFSARLQNLATHILNIIHFDTKAAGLLANHIFIIYCFAQVPMDVSTDKALSLNPITSNAGQLRVRHPARHLAVRGVVIDPNR